MELQDAIARLQALAQEARLRVFRLLVRSGPDGRPAGEIAASLEIPPQTLSFHLKHLTTAGLIESRRAGRSLIYSLRADSMRDLLAFLSEDCCQGRRELCIPLGRSPRSRIAAAADTGRPTVLFLCSKNSARSQMAAALLRQRAGDRFTIHSAGLRPEPVHPLTLQVLDELGLDTKACQPRDLGEFIGRVPIHFAIVVCDRANQDCAQMFPFAQKRLYWPFEDPAAFDGTAAARLERFRAVRDAIDVRIRDFVDDLPRSNERAG